MSTLTAFVIGYVIGSVAGIAGFQVVAEIIFRRKMKRKR